MKDVSINLRIKDINNKSQILRLEFSELAIRNF